MIVVDASALVAIAQREPDYRIYQDVLAGTDAACISPINYLETGIILVRRKLLSHNAQLDVWLASLGIELREDTGLGVSALQAYLRYGKGFHQAGLNLADCFAYAFAKRLDAPLLYKGDDFAKTDIRSAL